MSKKSLLLLVLVAAAGYGLTRATPPVPPGATAADSAAVAKAGYGARFQYGVGAVGSKLLGSSVRSMVSSTELSLKEMSGIIKKATGGEGDRARRFSKKIMVMDSAALSDLHMGHPISAFKTAMEAKSLLASVRDNVRI
ncbi:MAG TPA: hypothetical protein VF021_09175 [Longimicrobiales bacterium]